MIEQYLGLRALGRIAVEAMSWTVQFIKELAYRPVMGRYYQYKTNPIDIHEVSSGARWLSIKDVRRTIPNIPRDQVLKAMFPQRFEENGEPVELRIEATALEELLTKSQDLNSIRFLRWLQKVVIFPAHAKATRSRSAA